MREIILDSLVRITQAKKTLFGQNGSWCLIIFLREFYNFRFIRTGRRLFTDHSSEVGIRKYRKLN